LQIKVVFVLFTTNDMEGGLIMKRRKIFQAIIALSLLLPWNVAARVQDNAKSLTSQSADIWRNYTNANKVHALAMEGDFVWAATTGGVVRWNRIDGTYVKYTATDGLAHNIVYAIAIDQVGHKWFGTWKGVSEFDGSTWTSYTTADGLAGNTVNAIAIDQAGHKWFSTGGGVSEFFPAYEYTIYLPIVLNNQ